MMNDSKRPFREVVKEYLPVLNGKSVPYGIGCAWFARSGDYRKSLGSDLQALQTAYEAGLRYYDTAAAYGESELTVGEFVTSLPRDSLFLATKSRVPYEEDPKKAREHVERSLHCSLERLRTEYLDLFQLHDVNTLSHVLAEGAVLELLQDLKRQGIIRYLGVATRPHDVLRQTIGLGVFDTLLTYGQFTPVDQCAGPVIADAYAMGVGVINASPVGYYLTGRDPRQENDRGHPELIARKQAAIGFYDFCREHGLSILTAALQFPLRNPCIDITLTGPANREQVLSTVQELKVPLFQDFWEAWLSKT